MSDYFKMGMKAPVVLAQDASRQDNNTVREIVAMSD